MPEGHIVHRLARAYARAFGGAPVEVTSPQGRFADSAALIDGRVLEATDAYGKHLLLRFAGDESVHVHLGLYGKVAIEGLPVPDPVGQVRLRLVGATRYADLRGPAACDLLAPGQVRALVNRLGPDPIRRDADPERAWHRVSSSRATIGALLMDQAVFAGVGNIYRAEALFRARVSPYRPGQQVRRPVFDAMWADLVVLMRDGVRSGRIDTVRPEHEPEAMGRAPREDRHGGEVYVYRREGQPCLVCGSKVKAADLQGRWLYWCGRCQRR